MISIALAILSRFGLGVLGIFHAYPFVSIAILSGSLFLGWTNLKSYQAGQRKAIAKIEKQERKNVAKANRTRNSIKPLSGRVRGPRCRDC